MLSRSLRIGVAVILLGVCASWVFLDRSGSRGVSPESTVAADDSIPIDELVHIGGKWFRKGERNDSISIETEIAISICFRIT
ncbi:MAG: hypothetical protein SGI77_19605 [Pirellulaceae bacterium]|nr:hypothetical protein [Pirellulaceae bacterium]